jgi:DNA repair protein RadC
LVQAGRLLGVDVLDHLIIGQGAGNDLRERRLGFNA